MSASYPWQSKSFWQTLDISFIKYYGKNSYKLWNKL